MAVVDTTFCSRSRRLLQGGEQFLMLVGQVRGFELQLPNVLLDRNERTELVGLAHLDTALFQQRSQHCNLIRHLLRTLLLAGVAIGPSLMDG